jgi:enoyl-CoA hydratase/carnithine racemase
MVSEALQSQVIVLRGAGENFCLGRELPAQASEPLTALASQDVHTEPILSLAAAFERTAVPIIGVVRGKVVGGGCAIAALCDVTIASEDATFQLPELQHGIPPCLAMAVLAPRVPLKAIVHLVYSAEPIEARRALAIGLVSDVLPGAELEGRAKALVERLCSFPRPAVQAVKRYMRSAPALDREAAAELARNLITNVVTSLR